jgi:hypothetical protein
MRFNYEEATGKLIGLNTFGIRLRHEMLDKWLSAARNMDYVIAHLPDANFDPEFYKTYEADVLKAYEAHSGKKISLQKRSLQRIFGI